MTIEVASLWEMAGEVMDEDLDRQRFIGVRMAAAKVWPFLASATSPADFQTRKHLAGEHLEASAQGDPAMLERLEAALDQDFEMLQQRRAKTYQEEQAEIRKKRPFTHVYHPIGWDRFDSKPHPGSQPIEPGSKVKNHGTNGIPRGPGGMQLVFVEDEHGNHQTVDTRSLKKILKGKAASLEVEAVSWGRRHYEDLASEISTLPDGEREQVASHFADHLTGTNPRYRPEQFLEAASRKPAAPGMRGYVPRAGTGTPNYSRGHYEHLARGVAAYPGDSAALARKLSDHFVQTQAGFNPSKFLEAAAPAQHMELPKAASAGLTLYQQVMASLEVEGMRKGAPFADYEDWEDCTSQNSDKRDPDAYCGEVQRRTEKSGNLAQYARMLNLRESNRSASADLRGVSAEERAWYLPQLFAAHRAATGEDWTSTEGLRRVQADEDSLGFNDGRSEGFARSVCAKAGAGPSRVASSVYEDDVLAVEAAGNRLAGRLLRALWHLESLGVIRESSGQQSWGQSGWDGSKVVPTGTQIQQSAQALRSALSQLSTSLRIRDREAGIANLGRALVSAGAPLGLIAYCGEIKHKTEDKEASVRHTAPGGGEHAPYRIKEEDGKFYVVNDLGERKNEDGYSSREEARDFQKALYANVPGAAESAKEDEKKKSSLKKKAALDPTQMQPGDAVTVHYHTADGKSGTCPATFNGPVEDDPTEDEDPAPAAPVAKASKTAAFPPAAAPAQQAPVDPADTDPAASVTYAFDYANGTFYVSDDGTGQWVDPAGSTFTFSAGDEGEDPVEDVAEEEEDDSDGGSDAKDDNAPPWAKKSSKEAAAALRCTHCGGAVEPENIDPDWGDLQICRNCEHQARLRGPAADPNEELRQFREMHTPREEEPSAEWLDRHSKKTAANPFLPGNNRFTGPANPYLTPTPPGASDDTSADTGTATPDDQAMAVMPPPGTSGVVQPTTAPVGAPGGNQEAHTVPQNITPPTQRASKLTAAVGVVCTGCGLQGEVALTHLARLVREGAELGCPRCGSFEVDAIDKEAVEDFSDFSAPKDPSDGSMSLPLANELHDVARVSEMARCSNCFHTFETTASNPADPIPNCPRCGSKATTVAGGWKGKLSSMVASVKTSNPGISAEDATALAERALALAGG